MRSLKTFLLILLVLSLGNLSASSDEKSDIFRPIDPIVSNIEHFGNINEYTGKVSSALGTFGTGKLSLSPHYIQNIYGESNEV